MKRFACIAFLLVLVFSACSAEEQTPIFPQETLDYDKYQLTFQTKEISNDSVGKDWSFTYTYNGQIIQSGYEIIQSAGVFSFQSIDVEVREKDKFDDVGKGTLTVAVCDGGSGKTQITVTETNGCYKGNIAVWEISCQINKSVG